MAVSACGSTGGPRRGGLSSMATARPGSRLVRSWGRSAKPRPRRTMRLRAGRRCGSITCDQRIADHEFGASGGLKRHRRRTHPRAPRSCRRTIHKLLSANSIVSRAVFLADLPPPDADRQAVGSLVQSCRPTRRSHGQRERACIGLSSSCRYRSHFALAHLPQ